LNLVQHGFGAVFIAPKAMLELNLGSNFTPHSTLCEWGESI
jgi:hypothetical protein